jgi:transposase
MDSTSLPVCHNRRITRNRVFEGLAERGRTAMGRFFGFKLYAVINHKGQIMAVRITRGNVDDREPVEALTKGLKGIVGAGKGYSSKQLFQSLYSRGLKLLVEIRKGMKNHLMPLMEKLLLKKRFVVETVFDILKAETNLQHTRHRSPANALVNILSALIAYSIKNNKPAIITKPYP